MSGIKEFLYAQRFFFAKLVCGAASIGLIYAVYLWFSYSQPMLGMRFEDASQSWAADKALAKYDAGLKQYNDEQFELAAKLLTEAFNACQSNEGGIPPGRKQLAADIKFVHANSLFRSKNMKAAKTAYEDCLRLDADNLAAKNNLELLNSMNGGKGPPDDSPGGAAPSANPKRGI